MLSGRSWRGDGLVDVVQSHILKVSHHYVGGATYTGRVNLDDAAQLARELMDHHGLHQWRFRFDRAKRRAGMVVYSKQELSLSRVLVPLYTPEQVRGVILHEIAHALVGPGHAHDALWRRTCIAIGGDGLASLHDTPKPEPTWRGVCPQGHEAGRFQKPTCQLSCTKCTPSFSHEAVFTWQNTKTGVIIKPADLPQTRSRPRKSRRRSLRSQYFLGRHAGS